MIILPVFILLVSCLFLSWLWSRRHMYILSWKLNGPMAFPLIGNLLWFLNQEEIINVLSRFLTEHKSPIRMWLGPDVFVVIDNPADIEAVLVSPHCMEKDKSYEYAKEGMATVGLVSSVGAVWRQHRKLIGQGFSVNAVNEYLPTFNEHNKMLIETLGTQVGKGPINLKTDVNVGLMNTILDTTLGHDIDDAEKRSYDEFFSMSQNIVSKRIYQPWHRIELYWRMTKWPEMAKKFHILHNKIFDKLIQQRLESGYDRITMIDRLLRVADEVEDFTLEDVKGECNTIMMAGSDTSALSSVTTILMLAIHTDHQERMFEEVRRVVGNRNKDITREDLDKLEYTDWCIRESMRLFPPVPIIARQNRKVIQLQGVSLPIGTSIVIVIPKVHRDPQYWGDDAHIFRPDRFSPVNYSKIHPYAYMAFSGGPRNCIGYQYAMAVVKLTVARLVLNYKFTSPLKLEDVRTSVDINTRFITKHLVEIHRRN